MTMSFSYDILKLQIKKEVFVLNGTELKCARIRRNKTTSEMASLIGVSNNCWSRRECGKTSATLEEACIIGQALSLTETEFCAIFFDGILPFRKE